MKMSDVEDGHWVQFEMGESWHRIADVEDDSIEIACRKGQRVAWFRTQMNPPRDWDHDAQRTLFHSMCKTCDDGKMNERRSGADRRTP